MCSTSLLYTLSILTSPLLTECRLHSLMENTQICVIFAIELRMAR